MKTFFKKHTDRFKRHRRRFAKFMLVGFAGFFVDSIILNLQLPFYDGFFLRRILAPFLSFEGAVLSNYMLYHLWVWKDRPKENSHVYWQGFIHYNLTAGIGFLIKLLVMNISIELFYHLSADKLISSIIPNISAGHLDALYINAGNITGVALSGIFNYIVIEKYIFKKN